MAKHRFLMEFGATPGNVQTAGSDAGWTEGFWDNTDLSEAAAAEKGDALRNIRLLVLTPGWRMTAIRISILDASNNLTRRGQLIKIAPQNGFGGYGMPADPINEQPWDSLNLAIRTVGGARRAYLLRGIGSDVVGASGQYLAPGNFVVASASFASGLAGRGVPGLLRPLTPLAVRTRTATAITALAGVLVVSPANVNLVASTERPLIHVPVNTVQAGNTVSITGVPDMLGINGQWVASGVQLDPLSNLRNYVQLAPRRRNNVLGTYPGGGTVRYWNWALTDIDGFTIGNGASRRTGRPPQQRRGRRSNRRS